MIISGTLWTTTRKISLALTKLRSFSLGPNCSVNNATTEWAVSLQWRTTWRLCTRPLKQSVISAPSRAIWRPFFSIMWRMSTGKFGIKGWFKTFFFRHDESNRKCTVCKMVLRDKKNLAGHYFSKHNILDYKKYLLTGCKSWHIPNIVTVSAWYSIPLWFYSFPRWLVNHHKSTLQLQSSFRCSLWRMLEPSKAPKKCCQHFFSSCCQTRKAKRSQRWPRAETWQVSNPYSKHLHGSVLIIILLHKSHLSIFAAAQPQPSPPCSHPGHIDHGLADWNTTGDVARCWSKKLHLKSCQDNCQCLSQIRIGSKNYFSGLPATKATTWLGRQRLSAATAVGSGSSLKFWKPNSVCLFHAMFLLVFKLKCFLSVQRCSSRQTNL